MSLSEKQLADLKQVKVSPSIVKSFALILLGGVVAVAVITLIVKIYWTIASLVWSIW